MTSKYDPWDPFFASLAGDEHRFTFEELERLTGVSLPASARTHAAWWLNSQYDARWVEHGGFASARVEDEVVTFRRTPPKRGRPCQVTGSPRAATHDQADPPPDWPRLILLGCVAEKHVQPLPARDLYRSPLWQASRGYAEASGQPWLILSAEHGLVEPDAVIELYDRSLANETARHRREWSTKTAEHVLSLAKQTGPGDVEIHAGAAYIDHGLEKGLREAGLRVHRSLKGLRIGEQLAWYRRRPQADRDEPLPRLQLVPVTGHRSMIQQVWFEGARMARAFGAREPIDATAAGLTRPCGRSARRDASYARGS